MAFDYSTVTPESIRAVTDSAIAAADACVDRAVHDPSPRTFAGTVAPIDDALAALASAYGQGAFMARVHPHAEVRDAGQAAEERLTKWRVGVTFRDDLYAALRDYAATLEAAGLAGEPRRYLDRWLADMLRAGHELPAGDRAEIERLRGRLVEIEVAFQRNIDDADDGLDMTRDELDGLSAGYIERLPPGAAPDTYHVSLDYPSVFPFLGEARRRDLRREMERRLLDRAASANRPLLDEGLEIRRRIAALFGLPSWADYTLQVKMARRPETVRRFYDDLVPRLRPMEAVELERMSAMLAADLAVGEPATHQDRDAVLRTWDWRYYDTQLRRRDYGIDPTEVSAYFPLDLVLDGLLSVTADVFGLAYRRVPGARAWHPDVALYEIADRAGGETLAYFYADLFPREGKFSHAAAFPLVVGRRLPDGARERPVSAIVANFTQPSPSEPSLLRHEEVVTLFHEFGHILHQSLARADFVRFAGIEGDWDSDFVEAPSQILEHWAWDAGVLSGFARHHRSGEPIPAELVRQLVAARDLDIAFKTLRQCYLGLLDLGLHDGSGERDVDAVNRHAHAVTGLPFHEGTFYPASFGHLFGGYDAGYYGYLWSKVYGDDMFSRFEREGVTNPDVGADYRRAVLEPGSSRDAADLLRDFLGRDPNNEAFLRHLGVARD
jgi:thimet oligopeptidase